MEETALEPCHDAHTTIDDISKYQLKSIYIFIYSSSIVLPVIIIIFIILVCFVLLPVPLSCFILLAVAAKTPSLQGLIKVYHIYIYISYRLIIEN